MIYVNPACGKCGRKFPHPIDRVLPVVAFCPSCARTINNSIQRSLYQKTGHADGGFSMVGGFVAPERQA